MTTTGITTAPNTILKTEAQVNSFRSALMSLQTRSMRHLRIFGRISMITSSIYRIVFAKLTHKEKHTSTMVATLSMSLSSLALQTLTNIYLAQLKTTFQMFLKNCSSNSRSRPLYLFLAILNQGFAPNINWLCKYSDGCMKNPNIGP